MLVAWYMAFRYRVEFMPLFVLAAGLGAIYASHWLAAASTVQRRAANALLVLLVLQVASAHAHGALYAASPWGPSHHLAQDGLAALYRHGLGWR